MSSQLKNRRNQPSEEIGIGMGDEKVPERIVHTMYLSTKPYTPTFVYSWIQNNSRVTRARREERQSE